MLELLWGLHWNLQKAYEYPGIHNALKQLRRENALSAPQWRDEQIQKLRRLLSFAGKNVEYYSRLFRENGFQPDHARLPDDLYYLPLLTKELIQKNTKGLIASCADRSKIVRNATGGSTGEPIKFFQDQTYRQTAAAIGAFVLNWWGIRPYDRKALIWGADHEFRYMSWHERFYQWRSRIRDLNAFRMTEKDLADFLQILARWRPPYLAGYASALEELAKIAAKIGADQLRFKAIRSTAETLLPRQRHLIEETFQSPVYNFYGSREINNLAAECPEERQLHLISTWRYIEIVDEQGNPVPDGTVGNIVVTDLSNYAMPFIRYLIGDVGSMASARCPCGRPSPVIEDLLGRSSDLIRTPDGQIIHGEFFTHLFYGRNDIREFQIHQKSLQELVIRYVPVVEDVFIGDIVAKIRDHMGKSVTIDVQQCHEIPVTTSGKRRFTISDVNEFENLTPRMSR